MKEKNKIKKYFNRALVVIITLSLITTGLFLISSNNISASENPEDNIIDLTYTFPTPQIKSTDGYHEITIEGLTSYGNPGMPVLPVKTADILLPQNSKIINIEAIHEQELTFPRAYNIKPGEELYILNKPPIKIQEYIATEEITKIVSSKINKDICNSTDPYPGNLYQIIGEHKLRGYKILTLNLYPIQYIPKDGTITYYDEITIKITTEPEQTKEKTESLFRGLNTDQELITEKVDNPNVIETYTHSTDNPKGKILGEGDGICDPTSTYEYVIITNEELKNANGEYTFQDLVQSKIDKGLAATIVTVEEILDKPAYWNDNSMFNDTQAIIRSFIKDAYLNWNTEYVLLGGDGDGANLGIESEPAIIPTREMTYFMYELEVFDEIPTDLYYSCLDGTWNSPENPYPENQDLSINDPGVSGYGDGFLGDPIVDFNDYIIGDFSMLWTVTNDIYDRGYCNITFEPPYLDLSEKNWMQFNIKVSQDSTLENIVMQNSSGHICKYWPNIGFSIVNLLSNEWYSQEIILNHMIPMTDEGFDWHEVESISIQFKDTNKSVGDTFHIDKLYFSEFCDKYWGEKGEDDPDSEVYIGRAPVDSNEEVSNFVMKTLAYDQSDDMPYLENVTLIGEYLGFGGISDWGGNHKDEIRYGTNLWGHETVGIPEEDYVVQTIYDRDNVEYTKKSYDISNYAGNEDVRIRFGIASNDQDQAPGIYIDDVEIIADGELIFFDNMENGDSNWIHYGENDDWEIGTPTSGPKQAHSGINAWGTNLSGDYSSNDNYLDDDFLGEQLVTSQIDLSGKENIILNFYIWHDIVTKSCGCAIGTWDYGWVDVSTDDGNSYEYPPLEWYMKISGWPKENIISDINNGVHIINHLGHGNNYHLMKLDHPVLMRSGCDEGCPVPQPSLDLNYLTNTNYFFGYSQACDVGSFDNRDALEPYGSGEYQPWDSIVEHMITSPHGAFAFIANTRFGIGSPTTSAPSQHFDREFFDALFGENIRCLSKALADSRHDFYGFIDGDMIRYVYYELTLFGDPEISIKDPPFPEHDITVSSIETDEYPIIDSNVNVYATIFNRGLNDETNVAIELLIDGSMVGSFVVPLIESRTKMVITFNWMFETDGYHQIEIRSIPLAEESSFTNNVKMREVYIYPCSPVKVFVLDSFGADLSAVGSWDEINANWMHYGDIPVVVDYSTLNNVFPADPNHFTYDDLVNSGADVLFISYAETFPEIQAFDYSFTDEEIDAISRYVVDDGHGLIVTFDSFDHNNKKLLPFLGLNESLYFNNNYDIINEIELLYGEHPIFKGLSKPIWLFDQNVINTRPRGRPNSWNKNELSTGKYIAKSSNDRGAIVINNGLVYLSMHLEESVATIAKTENQNLQLIYNAMIWSRYMVVEHDIGVTALETVESVDSSDPVIVTATISNYGLYDESQLIVDLIVDDIVKGTHTISVLKAGESENVSFEWVPTLTDNDVYSIEVKVHPVTNEPADYLYDNSMKKSVVALPKIWITPESLYVDINQGSIIIKNVIIGNNGMGPLNLNDGTIYRRLNPLISPHPLKKPSLTMESNTIDPGMQSDLTITIDARTRTSPGRYKFQLIINSNDPDRSRIFIPIIVNVIPLPDLTITSTYGDQISDHMMQLTTTIRNIGDADANTSFNVGFYGLFSDVSPDDIQSPDSILIEVTEIPSLRVNEFISVEIDWEIDPKIKTIYTWVDATNDVDESNEGNNGALIISKLQKTLLETKSSFEYLDLKFNTTYAEYIIEVAQNALMSGDFIAGAYYKDPKEYVKTIDEIVNLEDKITEELNGQIIPASLLDDFRLSIKELQVLIDEVQKDIRVTWDEVRLVAETQLDICDIVYAISGLRVQNIDTGERFSLIQEAIDDENTLDGHTVFAHIYTYQENLILNKSINLEGRDINDTIIDGSGLNYVIIILANRVKITGFTIQNSGNNNIIADAGIIVLSSENIIHSNNIRENKFGIYISNSTDNKITNNIIYNNQQKGIYIDYSSNNSISKNTIKGNNLEGIDIHASEHNNISYNNIIGNQKSGIKYEDSGYNNIHNNIITNNTGIGLKLKSTVFTTIKHNILNNNGQQGISLTYGCDQNNISNNYINNNSYMGVFLGRSSYNDIKENNIHNNYHAGISLHSSSKFNQISKNRISTNKHYGLYLEQNSDSNLLSENIITNNRRFHGISIENSKNNEIVGNYISNNKKCGIYVVSDDLCSRSENTLIFNNIISYNNESGIRLEKVARSIIKENAITHNNINGIHYANGRSSNHVIQRNNISNNNEIGISLSDLQYTTIDNNIIKNNNEQGMILAGLRYCDIIYNLVSNNSHGIYIKNNGKYNSLIGNIINLNDENGLYLQNGDFNSITMNQILDNNVGIMASSYSIDNKIYNNNIINNTMSAFDDSNNTWDNGSIGGGNYWSDFDEPSEGAYDNNGDGFVDSPYDIPGLGGNQDQYPSIEVIPNPVVNLNTGEDFVRIQDAIDDSDTLDGHTISVNNGLYFESIVIHKSINLIGEDKENTIIIGDGIQNIVTINADYVNISRFTIKNNNLTEHYCNGIIVYSNNCNIFDNIMKNTHDGITLHLGTLNNKIYNNIIIDIKYICIYSLSNNNTIIKNTIKDSLGGIILGPGSSHNKIYDNNIDCTSLGVYLARSDNNTLIRNSIKGRDVGIYMDISSFNRIFNNTISNNIYGLLIWSYSNNNSIYENNITSNNVTGLGIFYLSNNNSIYHNNFMNNTEHAHDACINFWHDGYPSGGNFWDDYLGVDEYSGSDQDIPGPDGIGDTPYTILGTGGNQDNYPLMNPY